MYSDNEFAQLGLFDARIPHYTSYPTTRHFNDTIGPDTFATWLQAVPEGAEISLYLHIPFCRRLCWFCACRTQGTGTLKPVVAYIDTLLAEIDHIAAHLPHRPRLGRLHWGGGTPTLLSPTLVDRLAGRIAQYFDFAKGYEFSVEIDPNEIDAERLATLKAAGMNRASIGIQDFDPGIQNTIGRQQSYAVTARAVDMLRTAGVNSFNASILFGLPHQTCTHIAESVQKLLALEPDRVALYGYAHVPWMARRQSMLPSKALPVPRERLLLFEAARQLFSWDGYTDIGIDHFVKQNDGLTTAQRQGRLRRNFQGYSDDPSDILIGIGASAISRFPQGYAQNSYATSRYTRAIRERRFATARGHAFCGEDLLRGHLIERIMCDFSVKLADLPIAQTDAAHTILTNVAKVFDGFLHCDNTGIAIPAEARALTRLVAHQLDAYALNKAGHVPEI